MSECAYGFQMSRYLQERVCYVGQSQVYEESSEQLKELLGVEVSGKQIERVCHCYGKLLEKEAPAQAKSNQLEVEEQQTVYGMVDGSMVLTREERWKEIKLGRLFTDQSHEKVSDKRFRIRESVYTAHLGGYKEFLPRWESEIPTGAQLILLADGAKWFWDWAKDSYPEALQILDYYHCKEYLCEFAEKYFKNKKFRDQWIEQQEERLFNDQVDEVIKEIKALPIKALEHNSIKKTILTYYENNRTRMLYGTYRKRELLIGSGPIEAAHRNVIQQRLKLAGQRWTQAGAQFMANLRVCRKSNRWNDVIELTNQKKWAA
jgi:hypothetical protein